MISQPNKNSQVPISTLALAIVIPLIVFGGIGLAMNQGWWNTTTRGRAPMALARNLSGTNVQGAGLDSQIYDPAGIRGNSTFGEIQVYFGIEASLIAQAFGIQAENPQAITAKFVDELYGEMLGIEGETIDIGTDAVKYFISLMTGIPFEPEEHTGLPESAIEIVLSLGPGLTEDQRQAMFQVAGESRTTRFTGVTNFEQTDQNVPNLNPQAGINVQTPFVWQGRTTFGEVMARGVSREQIERVLGMALTDPGQSVRAFADAHGLQYNSIRTALSALMEE